MPTPDAGPGARALHEALRALQTGDMDTAHACATRALDGFSMAGDRTGTAAAHQVLAITSLAAGRPDDSLAHVDAAIPLRESTGDTEGLSSLWQERMELCLRMGRIDEAQRSAEAQVQVAARGPDKEGHAHALHQLAQILLQSGDDGGAEVAVNEALYLLDPGTMARARSALHLIYSNIWLARGNADRALDQARQGLQMARAAKNRVAEIDALHQCGVVHAAAGENPAAKRALEEALVGRELLKDLEGRASVLRELAGVELAMGEGNEALAHLRYAVRTLRETGNVLGEIAMLQTLAETADHFQQPAEATAAARELVDAAGRVGDREAVAGAYFMLATRQAGLGELGEAAEAFRTANEIQEVLGLAHEAAVSQGMLGQVLVAGGSVPEGVALMRTALSRLEALNSEAADTLRAVLDEVSP